LGKLLACTLGEFYQHPMEFGQQYEEGVKQIYENMEEVD